MKTAQECIAGEGGETNWRDKMMLVQKGRPDGTSMMVMLMMGEEEEEEDDDDDDDKSRSKIG